MLTKHHSLVLADKVLTAIKKIGINEEGDGDYDLLAYQNGREQGWQIRIFPKDKENANFRMMAVAWSEYRMSDEIVVYSGRAAEQAVSDEAYKYKRFWPNSNRGIMDAANYIIETVRELYNQQYERTVSGG